MARFYVDELQEYGDGKHWCHLWTDGTVDDLNRFAVEIGLKLAWLQISEGRDITFWHYDLRASKRKRAVKHGAIETSLRQYLREKGQAHAH